MSVRDGSALLRAIRADPADDFPRLLYADWCEENGQDERAEYVRHMVTVVPSLKWGQCSKCLSAEMCEPATGHPVCTCDPQWRRAVERGRETLRGGHPERGWIWAGPPLNMIPNATFTYRRGFIWRVRCPLAAWIGERCAACMEPNEDVPHPACRLCHGTGLHSGHGRAIMAAHPVQRVELSDREPIREAPGTERMLWWCGGGTEEHPGEQACNLPPSLWALLHLPLWGGNSTWKVAPTREAALDALSDACVLYATPIESPPHGVG